MRKFPQYPTDMQKYAGWLYELNELDRLKIGILEAVGYDINNPTDYLDRLIGTPLDGEMLELRKRIKEVDARLTVELDMLISKGFLGYQLPYRSAFDNFIDWREYFNKKPAKGGDSS